MSSSSGFASDNEFTPSSDSTPSIASMVHALTPVQQGTGVQSWSPPPPPPPVFDNFLEATSPGVLPGYLPEPLSVSNHHHHHHPQLPSHPISFEQASELVAAEPVSPDSSGGTGFISVKLEQPSNIRNDDKPADSTGLGKRVSKGSSRKRKRDDAASKSCNRKRQQLEMGEVAREEQRQQANVRERERTKQLNVGFTVLREIIPTLACDKLSKIQTLKLAALYIRFLIELNEKKERGEVEDCERRYGTKDQLKANFNYWRSAGAEAAAGSQLSDYSGGAESDGSSDQANNLLRFLSSAGFDNFGANDNENEEQDGRELTLKGCD